MCHLRFRLCRPANPESHARIFARDFLGRETVLLEGEFWVRDARIDEDALVVETETSRHALVINRSRVYLIVP